MDALNPGRLHVRLLRHPDRLGGRRGRVPLRARSPPRATTRRPRASCASAGRRSSSSASRATGARYRDCSPTAWPRGRASAATASTSDDGEALARSMESWQPFPDTVPALRAARDAGLRLWILSNTDRAIMEHSLRHLEVDFDGVTVAEDCRAYKPVELPFEQRARRDRRSRRQILHVAFGFKYDIGPAQELGMRTAWVNRKQEASPGPRAGRLRVEGPLAAGRGRVLVRARSPRRAPAPRCRRPAAAGSRPP